MSSVELYSCCSWPTVHLFLHRETSEMLCHFLLTLYAKSKNIWSYYLYVSHFEAIYGGNKWKKKPSLPACFPSYSRWGQTHPYLNHSTQKTNYQVFLPQKFRNRRFQTPQNILRSSPSLEGYASDWHDCSLYRITNNFCCNTSWMSFLSVEYDCCICDKLQIPYFSEQVKLRWTSEYWMWNHGDWQWGKIP